MGFNPQKENKERQMKVQAINTNNYQQNRHSFKGIIKSEAIKDLMTKTPVMIQDKFKAKEFAKAVNRAQWPKNLSYDKGADWWLRKNAKTYGYKYSAQKIK